MGDVNQHGTDHEYLLSFYHLSLIVLYEMALPQFTSSFITFDILNLIYSLLTLEPSDGFVSN